MADGEPFNKFFNRAARSIRLAMSSFSGDGLSRIVQKTFGLLGDRTARAELDRHLKGPRGHSSQQVFLGVSLVACSFNLLVSVFNWMHGAGHDAEHEVKHLSSAHRRVHARMARTLEAPVSLSSLVGVWANFCGDAALQWMWSCTSSGCARRVLTMLSMFRWQIAWNPLIGRRPRRVKRGYTWLSASYPELVKRNVQAGLRRCKKPSQVAKHGGVRCLAAFAVPKDDSEDRVSTDPSVNQLLDPDALPRPQFVYIPSLRSVSVPRAGLVVVWKRDARRYFHRLQIGRKSGSGGCVDFPSISVEDVGA